MNDIHQDLLDVITKRTVETIPESLLEYYERLPGRNPSDLSRKLARLVGQLDRADALELIRDVVDATVFQMLYLIDVSFIEANIAVRFERSHDWEPDEYLHELYRLRVDPHGIILNPE